MNIAVQLFPAIAALIFFAFPVALGLANTLLLALLVVWLARGRFREDFGAMLSNPVIFAMLVLYCVILIGASYSSAPTQDILLHLKKYSKLIIVPILFCALSDPWWQRRCLAAFSMAMLFVLASTWLNIWFLLPWSASQELGWGRSHHVFGDYITQNVMMSFFVLLCLTFAYSEASKLKRIAAITIAILGVTSITHLSNGRTGYVLVAVALLTFVLSQFQGIKRWLALLIVFLTLGFAFSSSQIIEERLHRAIEEAKHSEIDSTTSIGHRLYNYKTTLALIQDTPLLGRGTGAYHSEICAYVENTKSCDRYNWHPHNQFLFFGADQGLLGIVSYSLVLFAMIFLAAKDKNPTSRTWLLGLALLLFTNSLFNSPLWSARESHFFLFMGALLSSISQPLKVGACREQKFSVKPA